jgi:chorismate mutase
MAPHEKMPADAGQEAIDELGSIRQSIDNIDAALIHLLAERFKFTQQVGRLKAAHGLPPADPERELLQIQRLRGLAEEARLDPAFAEKFLNFIIAEVIHHHEKIAGTESATGSNHRAAGVRPDAGANGTSPAAS